MLTGGVYYIAIFGILLYLVVGYVKSRLRFSALAKLGSTPRMVPYRLPFGFDTLLETIDVAPTMTDTDAIVQSAKCQPGTI
jgi:hypothetical protein